MPRPYNLKTRKDAVQICTMLASNKLCFAEAIQYLGIKPSSTGPQLAGHAYNAVSKFIPGQQWPAVWSEAAELIHSGWRLDEPLSGILPVEYEGVQPHVPDAPHSEALRPDAGDPERMRHNDERGMAAYDADWVSAREATFRHGFGDQDPVVMQIVAEEDAIENAMKKTLDAPGLGHDTVFPIGTDPVQEILDRTMCVPGDVVLACAGVELPVEESAFAYSDGEAPTEPSPEGEPGDYGSDS